MTDIKILKEKIRSGELNAELGALYTSDKDKLLCAQKRYIDALEQFERLFPNKTQVEVFSAPGRTEICGNHTDHNNGKTLAGAIGLDVIAVVSKNDDKIEIHSEGFSPDFVSLSDMAYSESEKNTSKALIKGVCAALSEYGFKFGGFSAYTTSNVLKGSGVSSSAAFEVLISTILNHLYNDGNIDAVTVAKASQYAENKFFGKTVTVSGLITGNDLIQALKDKDLGEALIIPSNMLRAETDVFLDDVTVPEAEQKLNCKILVSYNGYDLAEKIAGVKGDEQRNNRNGGFYETDSCNSW